MLGCLAELRGYRAVWSLADTKYSGSLVLLRESLGDPVVRTQLPELGSELHHPDGRIVLASFATFDLLATYAPNNGSTPESFARRGRWDAALQAFLRTPVNNSEYFPPNFEGLVLDCIDADFCK